MYTVRDAAARLGISREALYKVIKAGHIAAAALPGTSDMRIHSAELDRYINELPVSDPAA